MRILRSFALFISNGFNVFSEASRGVYTRESEEISKIRSDLFHNFKHPVNTTTKYYKE